MKKIPRDINGYELIQRLKTLDYHVTRQSGSHIRLTTHKNGVHHITVPNHKPLKIGTLSNILTDIADHFKVPKQKITEQIF